MRAFDNLALILIKTIRLCIVVIVLFSISNSFIFHFIDSAGFDFIEYTDFAEGETETESEKESEKEIEDEFLKTSNLGRHGIFNELNTINSHSYYHTHAYIDISIPPPEFA